MDAHQTDNMITEDFFEKKFLEIKSHINISTNTIKSLEYLKDTNQFRRNYSSHITIKFMLL